MYWNFWEIAIEETKKDNNYSRQLYKIIREFNYLNVKLSFCKIVPMEISKNVITTETSKMRNRYRAISLRKGLIFNLFMYSWIISEREITQLIFYDYKNIIMKIKDKRLFSPLSLSLSVLFLYVFLLFTYSLTLTRARIRTYIHILLLLYVIYWIYYTNILCV